MKNNESQRLLASQTLSSHGSVEATEGDDTISSPTHMTQQPTGGAELWGPTPGIRQKWLRRTGSSFIDMVHEKSGKMDSMKSAQALHALEGGDGTTLRQVQSTLRMVPSGKESSVAEKPPEGIQAKILATCGETWGLSQALSGTPGLLIAVILNLFLSTSFGLAFFPSDWEFPDSVPRAIGVQMFLFSTVISQLVFTRVSQFPTAMGMMMVENIPFMHVICRAAMEAQGMGRATFATVFVTFAFSSIVVGVFFLVLGKLKLGSVVHFFPKHVIVGCIGGIGIFIFQTGLEVSTNQQWQWDVTVMSSFFTAKVIPLWLVSAGFEVVLRVISSMVNLSLLPPFYFVSIPVIFYIVVFGCGYDLDDVHKNGWFFEGAESVNPLLMWELMDFTKVDWSVFAYCLPTIIALTLFSLMHVPINIPSLTISTGHHSDMNNELVAHGISNIVSGATGGLQNYLCYSNSLLYFKCNGGGAFSGYCLSLVTLVFFFVGPSAVYMIPRCMAGCLLMHVGIDLTREGLWDSREGLDMFEYSSVVAIAVTMTFYGLTAGLVLGVICAAVTFTIQLGTHGNAIRGTMRAATLRSSRWRSVDASATLGKLLRHVLVVQLQGHLFFGNATTFAEKVENYLKDSSDLEDDIWFLILDFTLVLGIDSSAAETVAGIYDVCRKHNVRLCYSSPSENGFPCEVPLTERLLGLAKPEREAISERASIQSQTKTDKSPHSASKTSPVIPFPENVGRGSGGRGRNSEGEAVSGIELIARELGGRENGGTANGSGGGDGRSNGNCRDRMTSADSSSGVSIFEAFEQTVHIANSLDDALAWCEDLMLLEKTLDTDSLDVFRSQAMSDVPDHLKQLYALCPRDVDIKAVDKLVTYFERRQVDAGTVLWKQGEHSRSALILEKGMLMNELEEEAGTKEQVQVGHLVGEYGLLNMERRLGTLTALEPSIILVLDKSVYDDMILKDPYTAFVLSRICMGYLGRRVLHVSNRIWESRCVPI